MTDVPLHARPQEIYVWGAWVWYYRFLSLLVYGTGLTSSFALYIVVLAAIRAPSVGTLVLVPLVVLLAGLWALWAWVVWSNDRQRVVRLALLPDACLRARNLYGLSRIIPLADITAVEYSAYNHHVNRATQLQEYYPPKLVVRVRAGPALQIDTQARFLDAAAFQAIFGFDPQQPQQRRGKYRKKPRGRIARS